MRVAPGSIRTTSPATSTATSCAARSLVAPSASRSRRTVGIDTETWWEAVLCASAPPWGATKAKLKASAFERSRVRILTTP